jgi:signal transduction histidine kinase
MPDTKASILIVDDRPEKLLALEAVLEDLNQHIVRAYSGREALRHVLDREFAVILLDVNMPGMDGFETASLIRQRKSSQHVPIIFITAFGDEMHAARGYSLGAVDYILAPVVPEVLRTKVAVFVDLYRKTEQTRRQAESLRRRAAQLQKLAAVAIAINGADSMERMLQTITDTARDIVGAHQAITLLMLGGGFTGGGGSAARTAQQLQRQKQQRPPKTVNVASFSDKYAHWRGRPLKLDRIATTLVAQSKTATRLTQRELHEHPDWQIVQRCEVPPVIGGMLAAPLTGHDAGNLGVIYLGERYDDEEFSNDDEAILVQLAQMASIAIENILFAEEREANRLKDEFLATLSHELRTPLNAILGWTQLLKMEGENGSGSSSGGGDSAPAAATEEIAHGLDVIERNARSQTKLIEDLLDVSRITTGKLRLSVKPVELDLIVRAAVDAVRPTIEAKQITLTPRLDASSATLSGDPDRLQQVCWNLLSNAAKFTPQGGTIDVTLSDSGTTGVMLSVRDSGAGIDPKFLPYVFDRFRQADSSSTRSHGGLGIGLTIVRHIVELHGGSVAAHSDGEGRGSTFSVSLPLIPAVAAPMSQPTAPETTTTTTHNATQAGPGPDGGNVAAAVSAQQPASRQLIEPVNLGGVRVLLVDDEPDTREVISQILRRCGALVKTASSAREALNVFGVDAGGVDVLVSDIAMPDEDGYFLIRELRGRPPEQGGTVPAVALTAYAREEDRQRALAAGFQSHLAKPVEPCDLAQAIASLAATTRRTDHVGSPDERPAMRLRLA